MLGAEGVRSERSGTRRKGGAYQPATGILLIVCFFLDTPEPQAQNPAYFSGCNGRRVWGYRAVLARLDRAMHQPGVSGPGDVAARRCGAFGIVLALPTR